MKVKRKRRYQAVEPDEILLDAQNLPGFDATRLEGKIERPIERGVYKNFLFVAGIVALIFFGQLVKLQVIDAATLKERAEANRLNQTLIIAERGSIVDRNGKPLALNDPQPDLGFAKRSYPLGEAAAHVVGYVSYPKKDQNGYWFQTTTQGLFGIESLDDEALRGQNGVEIRESSATGEVVSGSVVRAPQVGTEIFLSLDADLQSELYEMIKERSEEAKFIGGSGVIMNVDTGEIVALASYPSFDPAALASGEESEKVQQYVDDARSPFLDRAVSGLYTPGSVVKPFIALAALEEHVITPEKQILSTGSISIPNPYNPSLPSVFKDWKAHGWVDMRHAIAVSSDVYFYEVGGGFEDQQGLGISAIDSWMKKFGFGVPTGVPLEGESAGVIPSPEWKAETFDGERWFLGNTYHTAIGQYGFQTTVLQLARGIAMIANGGTLVTPTIHKDEQTAKEILSVKPENIRVVQEGMRLGVKEGTAQVLNIGGVSVAAKTGTAEVGVHKEFINSVVVGFFPTDHPRYSFAVVMERAKAGTLAGAPLVMHNVLQWIKTERPEMLIVD